ncbi:MAG: hypothetical protein ED859_04235 [Desulfuromonadales bacterium]|nr:MAG: hypothetical protein ED859_04235 [Desulfuromonadales bacterium]
MKQRVVALIILAAFTVTGFAGCVTVPEEHKGAAKGAGIGGATGAIAGAVLAGEGSRTKGAVIGGLAGALLGGIIGNYTIDKKLTAEQTASKYNFQPSSGTMVRVENITTSPSSVSPSDKIDIQTTYALLTSAADVPVGVIESVEIRFENELVGNPQAMVTHGGGTYTFTVPIYLPSDAKKGTYRVITSVRTDSGSDTRETTFTVK